MLVESRTFLQEAYDRLPVMIVSAVDLEEIAKASEDRFYTIRRRVKSSDFDEGLVVSVLDPS